MAQDPYQILGVKPNASAKEIKAAYRYLVKQHHPDAGGDETIIISINAAWEILRDSENRLAHDKSNGLEESFIQEAKERGDRNAYASAAAKEAKGKSAAADDALMHWLVNVYVPIDRLLGKVINPFQGKLNELSADPYDDLLMTNFCSYLEQSQSLLKKVTYMYQAIPTPASAKGFGLSLYHCLSQVQDAINELERYTMGYVDNYLHDGREMLLEAKQRRKRLKKERARLKIS